MHLSALVVALGLVALLLTGCVSEPAGPRPTLPHPSWAPIRMPAAGDPTPRARPARKPGRSTPTPRPAALTDAEWRPVFCATQDAVFNLSFAIDWAADVGDSHDWNAFRRSLHVLDGRVEKARAALLRVPARYALPLVSAERRFLRGLDQMVSRFLVLLRTRSPRDVAPVKIAARSADLAWRDMVKANQRLQLGEHRLVC
ncbi:MAG: hypothetical protein U0869_02305 [Chloroflexota bacterium]